MINNKKCDKLVAELLDSSKYLPNIIQPRISLFYNNTLKHVTVYRNLHLSIQVQSWTSVNVDESEDIGWLSIDAVVGRTAGLKNGVRFPHTIL